MASGGSEPRKKGTRFEYSVVAKLRREGFGVAVRSYASKGPWDVLAIRSKDGHPECWLVQAKLGGYMRPAEREALIALAWSVLAKPILAKKVGGRIKFFRVTEDGTTFQVD